MDAVLKFAKAHDYKSVQFRGRWKEYDVYEGIIGDGLVYVGLPQFILASGQKVRMAEEDEIFDILDSMDN